MNPRTRRRLGVLLVAVVGLGTSPVLTAPAHATPGADPVTGFAYQWGGHTNDNQPPADLARVELADVDAGYNFTAAVTTDGRVRVWGMGSYGVPVPEAAQGRAVDVEAGEDHLLTLTGDGELLASGGNAYGQGTVPAALAGQEVTAFSTRGRHNLALTADGTVHGWGSNTAGQADIPAEVAAADIVTVGAGDGHSIAVDSAGRLYAWGETGFGATTIPAAVANGTVVDASAGNYSTAVLLADGTVHAWGFRVGSPTFDLAPGESVVDVDAGGYHAVALTSAGRVLSWGEGFPADYEPYRAVLVTPQFVQDRIGRAVSASLVDTAVLYAEHPFTEARVTLSGEAKAGMELTATTSASPTPDAVSYRWLVDGEPVTGATGDTFQLDGEDTGRDVTVEATFTRDAHTPTTATAVATDVAPGDLGDRQVAVVGESAVGKTVVAAPSGQGSGEDVSYTWFHGTDEVATGDSYLIPPAARGQELSVRATFTRTGYHAVEATASGGVVAPGTFEFPWVDIHGDPVVGQTLTADGHTDPLFETATYSWRVDGVEFATGETVPLPAEAAGKPVTVHATFVRDGFTTATATDTTDPVAAGTLTDAGVSITGVAKVGESLTAQSTSTPTPDQVTYTWAVDGTDAGTGPEFVPTDDAAGKTVTVTAVLTRAGYDPATVTSAGLGPVAHARAPSVALDASRVELRLGQRARLTWSAPRATTVTATRAWDGTLPASGTRRVTPTRTGTVTYRVTATNDAGTTTAQVVLKVALPKTTLTVTAPRVVEVGDRARVRVRGLAPRERYTARLGGTVVGKGRATRSGTVSTRIVVPNQKVASRRVGLRVTGSLADRTGRDTVRVKRHALRVTEYSPQVRASDTQRVTVAGLKAGERVVVRYKGEVVETGRAGPRGFYTARFDVGRVWGTFTTTLRALTSGVGADVRFTVVQRCPSGVTSCN